MKSGFLWGVASSGYQCEGGYNGTGQPQNNWAGAERTGEVMTTGRATDFWNRFNEDFALCQQLGLNSFRLSVEWARVQPTMEFSEPEPTAPHPPEPSEPPPFDEAAIGKYAEIIASCRQHGMEPVITLQHFTHPAWLGTDAWLRDDTPALFAKFSEVVVDGINTHLVDHYDQKPIHWFVTLNEPNMLVLNTYLNQHFPGGGEAGLAVGVRAYNRLLAAHVRSYNAIHDLYAAKGWAKPMVTMNTFCSDAYWSEQMLLDLLQSRQRGISRDQIAAYLLRNSKRLAAAIRAAKLPFHLDPFVWIGRLFHHLTNRFAPPHANGETFAFFLKTLEDSPRAAVLDYLGIDYYDPFTGHIFRPPSFHDLEFKTKSVTGHLMAGLSRKWWDWHVLPEGLHFFCQYYHAEYPGLGILIAENGMALRCKMDNTLCSPRRDKITRSEFLKAHIAQVRRLVDEDVPMLGYLHWSITDNYEWGSFTPRFGLFSIDYLHDAKRLARDPFGDQPSQTYASLIKANPTV